MPDSVIFLPTLDQWLAMSGDIFLVVTIVNVLLASSVYWPKMLLNVVRCIALSLTTDLFGPKYQ